MAENTFQNQLKLAKMLAKEAGVKALAIRSNKALLVDKKPDGSPTSNADREAERIIVDGICARYPNDGILGEEGSSTPGNSELTWVIDPIDGTTNYLNSGPFGVSVGLVQANKPVLGVIYLPETDEMYAATTDSSATRNGVGISVARPRPLNESLITTCNTRNPTSSTTVMDELSRLDRSVRGIRVSGAAVQNFTDVAKGYCAGMVLKHVNLWDIVAGLVICRAAGAKITTSSHLTPGWQNPERTYSVVLGIPAIVDDLNQAWARAQGPGYKTRLDTSTPLEPSRRLTRS